MPIPVVRTLSCVWAAPRRPPGSGPRRAPVLSRPAQSRKHIRPPTKRRRPVIPSGPSFPPPVRGP